MIKRGFILLLGIFILVFAWFIFPVIFIYLNIILNLPVYSNSLINLLGITLFTLGFSLTLYTVHQHFLTGRITPVVIEPPKMFIVKGLYKYTRNPMYIAIFTAFLGMFMMFGHLLLLVYAVSALVVFHILVVFYEEPQLKKTFGKQYADYLKKVPRWTPKI